VKHFASGTDLFRVICDRDMERIVAKQASARARGLFRSAEGNSIIPVFIGGLEIDDLSSPDLELPVQFAALTHHIFRILKSLKFVFVLSNPPVYTSSPEEWL
jgi:hypothetical protein